MKKIFLTSFLAASICLSCVAHVGPHGSHVAIAPPLPLIVELGEPYYVYGGYYYHYDNDRWYYSRSQGGPWIDLPRDRYPKEVRFKGRGNEKGKGWKHGHDRY